MGDKHFIGEVISIDGPIASKGRNNAKFYAVTIKSDMLAEEMKFYDWKHLAQEAGIQAGDHVDAVVTEGDYPRLLKIAQTEKPARSRQASLEEPAPKYGPKFTAPATTPSEVTLEVLKLAVQLVAAENVDTDKKVLRVKTAFAAFKDLLKIEALKPAEKLEGAKEEKPAQGETAEPREPTQGAQAPA